MTADVGPGGIDDRGGLDRSGRARRLVLRGGLGATPVLLSLASTPVSAGVCKTASAFASLQPSGHQSTSTCGGSSPSTWNSASPSVWPVSQGTTFGSVFSPALSPDIKIKDLFALSSPTTVQTVAQHCAAAYLNASTSPPLTPATILSAALAKNIWTSYATTGFYSPTAGVNWGASQIVAWITTTYA